MDAPERLYSPAIMRLKIREYGDPVLREKATRVESVDDRIRELADDMIETMHVSDGIGLAAEQVGERVALCVVDVPDRADTTEEGKRLNPDVQMPLVLINPEIVSASRKTDVYEEGCLSFPDIRANVERPYEVIVRYTDREGRAVEQTLRALVGRCVQHEMDHLNGILICDRMSAVKKVALSGRLKRLRQKTRMNLGIL